MKLYALQNIETGRLMSFVIESNDGSDFCNSVSISLEDDYWPQYIWTTFNKETAEKAAVTNTPWYNAGMGTPMNEYVGKLKVVELSQVEP